MVKKVKFLRYLLGEVINALLQRGESRGVKPTLKGIVLMVLYELIEEIE